MVEESQLPSSRIYAKTAVGGQEIQARGLGLSPLLRRLLILVDGKRSVGELVVFVQGQDIGELLKQLVDCGCIVEHAIAPPVQEAKPVESVAGSSKQTPSSAVAALEGLPPPETRSAKDIQMARTFMTNTINTMFPQHSRLTLIEAIHACKTAGDLRGVYPDWANTMSGSAIGAKRLPELSRQLFTTL